MCLRIIGFKTKQEAIEAKKGKIAKKDILVYKMLQEVPKGWATPYRGFRMELDMLYYQDSSGPRDPKFTFWVWEYGYNNTCRLDVNRGLHAFTKLSEARSANPSFGGYKIFRAIVPKGSTYFLGKDNDICSDQLIITSKEVK